MKCLPYAASALLLLSLSSGTPRLFAQDDPQAANGQQTAPPAPYPTGDATPLGVRVAALLRVPNVAGAHWGIAVTSLDGTPLYGLDEAKLFRPASTAKLFTTAAAMAMLGPDYTVTTKLTGELDTATGTLHGDLNLVGGGDASFGTNDVPYRAVPTGPGTRNDLASMADQLVAKGLHRITGDIVGNDQTFGHEPAPEGWAADDLLWGYGALPSALSVGDNELRLTITPGEVKFPAVAGSDLSGRVTVEQLAPYVKVRNEVVTAPADTKPQSAFGVMPVTGQPTTLRVFGTVAIGAAPIAGHVAVPDAAQYAAESLQQMLVQRGIVVDGTAKALHAITDLTEPYLTAWRTQGNDCGRAYPGEPANCNFICGATAYSQQLLAAKTSAPLHEDITYTLKTSANLHAEMLLHQLGLLNSCPGAPAVNGARLIRSYLIHAGLAPEDFVFYDGSGLSTKDLVTPRAETQLLAYATKQPWFAQWKAALPVGGVDGTLSARFTTAPLKGHVFAKTGTLGESRTLAGYVQCASGREVIFSILVDNHEPGSSADRTAMDRIVEAIAALE